MDSFCINFSAVYFKEVIVRLFKAVSLAVRCICTSHNVFVVLQKTLKGPVNVCHIFGLVLSPSE